MKSLTAFSLRRSRLRLVASGVPVSDISPSQPGDGQEILP